MHLHSGSSIPGRQVSQVDVFGVDLQSSDHASGSRDLSLAILPRLLKHHEPSVTGLSLGDSHWADRRARAAKQWQRGLEHGEIPLGVYGHEPHGNPAVSVDGDHASLADHPVGNGQHELSTIARRLGHHGSDRPSWIPFATNAFEAKYCVDRRLRQRLVGHHSTYSCHDHRRYRDERHECRTEPHDSPSAFVWGHQFV
jgi:hypothetical protein